MNLRLQFIVAGVIATLALPLAATSAETAIEGSWQGVLSVSGAQLHVVFNITRSADGALAATMDSPDQGAKGIPVGAVTFEKGHLHLDASAVKGTYEGDLNSTDGTITGTWAQGGMSLPLTLTRGEAAPQTATPPTQTQEVKLSSSSDANDVKGTWSGTLAFSGASLRVVFNLAVDSTGKLSSTMDSPDQGARDIPVDSTTFAGGKLRLVAKGIAGIFDGGLSEDKASIVGTWGQGGVTIPLTLVRSERIAEPERPQNPKPPLPYDEREVSYPNSAAGITLAGTLTLPREKGPFPAVLLITGSGAQDRNETVFGHKPFLVLADYLTRRGIAVLRVDDRGIGKSTGTFKGATTPDFASDALAGVQYLKGLKEIDPRKIGLIGHSEGGIIAPMVAYETPDVAFIVLIAGPGLPGEEIILAQSALIAKAEGAGGAAIAKDTALNRKAFTVAMNVADSAEAAKQIRQIMTDAMSTMTDEEKKLPQFTPDGIEAAIKQLLSPWFIYFLKYDPKPTLMKVKCPVLAVNGEKDLQVPPKEDLKAIEEALKAGRNKDFTVKELPGLNHLLQTAKTGSPTEYSKIDETMSPSALSTIGDWILAHTKKK